MPITRLQDVIQPEIFTQYTVQRTMELSELVQCGIIENDKELDTLATGPNTLINMPYWKDLGGDAEEIDDKNNHTPGKIETGKDIARKTAWVKSFGANNLTAALAGDDPMRVIADRFAPYWVRHDQAQLLAMLDGVFASDTMNDKLYDITGKSGRNAVISGSTFADAVQLMGDAKDLLTGVMMHSATETDLIKKDLIEFKKDSEGELRLRYFMGKKVIVDDSMPYDTTTNSSFVYLFGQGAIGYGNGAHPNIQQTEVVRNGMSKAGEDILVNRKIALYHPRGIKWLEESITSAEGQFPKMADLAKGENWQRVYEPKAIRIVKFIFKLGEGV